MREYTVSDAESRQRLDKYLKRLLPLAPPSFFYKMLRKKNIVLNGQKAQGNEMLTEGDRIKIYIAEETFGLFEEKGNRKQAETENGNPNPENTQNGNSNPESPKKGNSGQKNGRREVLEEKYSVAILYEDRDILIADKPAGLLTQGAGPKSGHKKEESNLNTLLLDYLSYDNETGYAGSVVHRLDRNTSGLVAFGKTLHGLQLLSSLFAARAVRKYYLTLCHGALKDPVIWQDHLVKDHKNNTVTITHTPAAGTDPIITEVKPLACHSGMTLCLVHLITGKPHQIRAHFNFYGHSLIGEAKYGPDIDRELPRQFLHAARLEFLSRADLSKDFPDQASLSLEPAYKALYDRIKGRVITSPLPRDLSHYLTQKGFSQEEYGNL